MGHLPDYALVFWTESISAVLTSIHRGRILSLIIEIMLVSLLSLVNHVVMRIINGA